MIPAVFNKNFIIINKLLNYSTKKTKCIISVLQFVEACTPVAPQLITPNEHTEYMSGSSPPRISAWDPCTCTWFTAHIYNEEGDELTHSRPWPSWGWPMVIGRHSAYKRKEEKKKKKTRNLSQLCPCLRSGWLLNSSVDDGDRLISVRSNTYIPFFFFFWWKPEPF